MPNYILSNTQLIYPKSYPLDMEQLQIDEGVVLTISRTTVETMMFDNQRQACRVHEVVLIEMSDDEVAARKQAIIDAKHQFETLKALQLQCQRNEASQRGEVGIIVDIAINKGAPSVACSNGGYTTVKNVFHTYNGYLGYHCEENAAIVDTTTELKIDAVQLHQALQYYDKHLN